MTKTGIYFKCKVLARSLWEFVCFLMVNLRKGLECHKLIIEGFLKNMEFGQEDLVVWMDACPNESFA